MQLTCHYLVAQDIVPNVKQPYQTLLRRGWIRVSMPQGRRTWAGIELRPRSAKYDGEKVYRALVKAVKKAFTDGAASGVTVEVLGRGTCEIVDHNRHSWARLKNLFDGGLPNDKRFPIV